jgi:hypothetical protein
MGSIPGGVLFESVYNRKRSKSNKLRQTTSLRRLFVTFSEAMYAIE